MKSMLRNRAATAMLLAPLALMAALPAAAQNYGDGSSQTGYEQVTPAFRDHGWDRRHRDHRAPVIKDVTPDQGDRVSDRGLTRIAARFDDFGSGVAHVSLRVDGRDVSRHARVDNDEIVYRENLRPGRHVAELQLRDRAGNVTRKAWAFTVVDRPPYGDRYSFNHR